ncbi:MAG: tRNA (N6-isopentenyl adenosine(37)-C2)-methylthiotransferase MiaB [Chromatiales bacterium]|nr:tRNA (N6-isopentenyl adenosine(37)-C2)-methylthiotransferase MiaB [Chromatiales bacterium]
MAKQKVYIKTHGCQMNEYDSAKIHDLLNETDEFCKVDSSEEADILLLNTCSVREKAQEKVFSELGRWRAIKEAKPNTLIGVGGCVASQEGGQLVGRAPQVDIVFGPQTIHRLADMIEQAKHSKQPVVDISFPEIEKFDKLVAPHTNGASAFVSIMEGCDKYCSFCVVPYTRGKEISRPLNDILDEIKLLTKQGVKEVTLLGQNVNGYYWEDDDHSVNFALLLYYVAALDNIQRIRYTTSHPIEFNDALIQAHADIPQLMPHCHLPVQSGSDRILAAMKRGYTVLEYKSIIRKLKVACPNISISSDFIVGFPGEDKGDFEKTMELIEYVGYDQSYSFLYSARAGTPAALLDDPVPTEIKKARLKRLQTRIDEMATELSLAMVGSEQDILVNGHSKKSNTQLCGRTENNRVVNFDGDSKLIGGIHRVKITRAMTNTLRGILIE